jgi:DNA processing protein
MQRQDQIVRGDRLIGRAPVERYEAQSELGNRLLFPERNNTIAPTLVEAGETSGTLVQAREGLKQKSICSEVTLNVRG